MAEFSEGTRRALMPFMQEGIEPKNPLDLGIPMGLKHAASVCEVVAKDPNIDMIAWAAMLPSKAGAWEGVEALQSMLEGTDKPIVGFGRMSYQMTPEAVEAQKAAGFPFLQGLEPTLRAMNGLWFHAARSGRQPAAAAPAPASDLTPATLDATLARYGIALPLLPVTAQDVTAMIDGLRLHKLLAGFRGRPPADRHALEATVRALAQFYLDHRARIEDIEINPLIVRPSGAVAVDVRVIWKTVDA